MNMRCQCDVCRKAREKKEAEKMRDWNILAWVCLGWALFLAYFITYTVCTGHIPGHTT